jgi:putative ABC transport system permease protein
VSMVIGQAVLLAVIGLGAGLATAAWLTQLISKLLYGVKATDPLTFVAVSVLLTAVAVVASAMPAWRATRVDPLLALRFD